MRHAIALALFFKNWANADDRRSSQHLRQALLDNDLQVAPERENLAHRKLAK